MYICVCSITPEKDSEEGADVAVELKPRRDLIVSLSDLHVPINDGIISHCDCLVKPCCVLQRSYCPPPDADKTKPAAEKDGHECWTER